MATYDELRTARKVVDECAEALVKEFRSGGAWELGREGEAAYRRHSALMWLEGQLASLMIQAARAERKSGQPFIDLGV